MDSHSTKLYLNILRWIFFLPAAIIAGFLAYHLAQYVIIFSFQMFFIDPNSFMGLLQVRIFSGALMGITLVYSTAYIVPSYKKIVAMIFTGLLGILAGITIYLTFMDSNYWSVLEQVAMVVSSIGMAFSILNGETKIS